MSDIQAMEAITHREPLVQGTMLDMKGTDKGATSRDLERRGGSGKLVVCLETAELRTPDLGHQKLASVVQ